MVGDVACSFLVRSEDGADGFVPCGKHLRPTRLQKFCEPHQRISDEIDDHKVFGPTTGDDLIELRRVCHAAPDDQALKRYYPGEAISNDPAWQEVRVEIIAFRLVPEVSHVPLGHPWIFEVFPNIDGACII